ncbi:MAG: D-alanine--D-alanine ligase [Alphaproteobacteria bacterium]|nr:D-alanine--D-alanine ligase [Alphaproteobacteria bacterium]
MVPDAPARSASTSQPAPGKPAVLLAVGISDEDRAQLQRLGGPDLRLLDVGTYEEASDPYHCQPHDYIERAVALAEATPGIEGVVGVEDFPPSLLVPAICRRLGLPGLDFTAAVRCEHKGWSRVLQQRLVPESTPKFALIDLDRPPEPDALGVGRPFWLKPIKSYLSYLGFRIADRAAYRQALAQAAEKLPPFLGGFVELIGDAAPRAQFGRGRQWMLAEELMSGFQCTLDGYVFGGEVTVLGVVDSIRFPNKVSFKRFQYPSALPLKIQAQMVDVAKKLMPGLGFDHGLFNIEFFWDPKRKAPMVIEVNDRLSMQFADLFEKVDGINSYRILIDLARGRRPDFHRGQGRYRAAASFVLRGFTDRLCLAVPSDEDIAKVERLIPDTVVMVRAVPGMRLSELPQDSYSFRHGLINIGGRDLADMQAKLGRALKMLPFRFAD